MAANRFDGLPAAGEHSLPSLGPGVPRITSPMVFVLSQILNALTVIIAIWIMGRTNLPLTGVALAPLLIASVVAHQQIFMTGPMPDFPLPEPPGPGDRLESLEVSGLTCLHPGSGRGIHGNHRTSWCRENHTASGSARTAS